MLISLDNTQSAVEYLLAAIIFVISREGINGQKIKTRGYGEGWFFYLRVFGENMEEEK